MIATRRGVLELAGLGVAALSLSASGVAARSEMTDMLIINALGDLENPNLALSRPKGGNPVANTQNRP